jgi:hypothetical protein
MRKGRSQRKTRGSLPSSKRAPSRLDAAAPSGGSGGPQVVVGLTAPLADESPLEPRADGADPVETVETRARGAEHLELVRERSLELVRESLELHEHDAPDAHEEHEEPAHAEQAIDAGERRADTLTFDAHDPFRDPRGEDTPQRDAQRDEKTADVSPAKAKTPARQMSLPTPDEMSIPPMGDLSVEPIADRFFSEGELAAAAGTNHDLHHEEWDQRAHKSVRKSLPEVVQRRARFAKYVRWAVGGAAVVCLAALARSVVPASPASASLSTVGARLESQQPQQPQQPRESVEPREAPVAKAAVAAIVAAEPVAAPDSVAAPIVAVPPAAPAATEAPAAIEAPAAAPAAAAPAAAAPAAAAPAAAAPAAAAPAAAAPAAAAPAAAAPAAPASDKTALQEKNDSRRALERGKLGDAIAAGERSVALDPTDGEAWLLLGAAYQEKGKNADARRCYSACIKEGKRGPVGECRAMIR